MVVQPQRAMAASMKPQCGMLLEPTGGFGPTTTSHSQRAESGQLAFGGEALWLTRSSQSAEGTGQTSKLLHFPTNGSLAGLAR
jgi:hypothetical protein